MEKLIKIAKRILKASFFLYTISFLYLFLFFYELTKSDSVFVISWEPGFEITFFGVFATAVVVWPFLSLLFATILFGWAFMKKVALSRENTITKLHLFIFFMPIVSFLLLVIYWFIPKSAGPPIPLCDVLTAVDFISYKAVSDTFLMLSIAFLVIGLGSALTLYLYKKRKDRVALFSLITLGNLIPAILILSMLAFGIPFLNTARTSSRDSRRIADVKQMQFALEFHFEKFGSYPKVDGSTPNERLQNLGILVSQRYIAKIPNDPCATEVPEHQYDYKNSPDGTSYVIRAILDRQQHTALSADIDGEIFGIWCGKKGKEREYCAMP